MSKHAKPTLVRFFRADEDMQLVLAKDWEAVDGWAKFTLPATSLVGSSLMNDGLIDVRVVVLSSEEVEWHIDLVERYSVMTRDPGEYRITCQSLARHTKLVQLPDEWILANFKVEQ